MTKREFVKEFADLVAEGRKLKFPHMRPSEVAMGRMNDEARAIKVWRMGGGHEGWKDTTVEQFRAAMTKIERERESK